MLGKEEWVLVYLGSQHKCVERPVWPVFPDCPFLVTMIQLNSLVYTKALENDFLEFRFHDIILRFRPNDKCSVIYIHIYIYIYIYIYICLVGSKTLRT